MQLRVNQGLIVLCCVWNITKNRAPVWKITPPLAELLWVGSRDVTVGGRQGQVPPCPGAGTRQLHYFFNYGRTKHLQTEMQTIINRFLAFPLYTTIRASCPLFKNLREQAGQVFDNLRQGRKGDNWVAWSWEPAPLPEEAGDTRGRGFEGGGCGTGTRGLQPGN